MISGGCVQQSEGIATVAGDERESSEDRISTELYPHTDDNRDRILEVIVVCLLGSMVSLVGHRLVKGEENSRDMGGLSSSHLMMNGRRCLGHYIDKGVSEDTV